MAAAAGVHVGAVRQVGAEGADEIGAVVGVVGQRGADARVAQAPQRRPGRRRRAGRAAARRRPRRRPATPRPRGRARAPRRPRAGRRAGAPAPARAPRSRRPRATTGARRWPGRAPRRRRGRRPAARRPRRRGAGPGRPGPRRAPSRRRASRGRARRHAQGDGAAGEVDAQPPGARDERLGLHGGAAQVLEQGARGPRPVGRGVAQRGQGERRDGGEAQDGLGARRGRAPLVEQHHRADLLAVGAHRGVGHVALGQRPGLPGQPRGDEAPDGAQAAFAAGPGHRGTDRRQDDGDRPAGGLGCQGGDGVEAVTGEDGVGHPPAVLWRGGAHRARWRRTTTCRPFYTNSVGNGTQDRRAPSAPRPRRSRSSWRIGSRRVSARQALQPRGHRVAMGVDRRGRGVHVRAVVQIGPEGGDDLGPQARVVLERRADAGGHAGRELGGVAAAAIASSRRHVPVVASSTSTCAAARELEHDARLAQRVVQALGAGHEGREADRGARAQARGDALRRGRRGAPRVVGPRGPGAAPRRRRPPAARARRGTARRWWGRPSPRGRAAGRTGRSRRAPARSRRRRRRPSRARRVGAGALAQRAHQRGPAAGARRVAHEGQRDQRGTGVQVAQGRPGQGVAGRGGGEPRGSRRTPKAASRPFARGQDRLCRRLAFAMLPAVTRDFTWRDGERIVRFGRGALAEAPDLLGDGYVLLTTPRAAGVGARRRRRRRRRAPRADRARRRGRGRPARRRRGRPARRARRRARRRRGQGAGRRPRRRRGRDPDDPERRRDDARAPPRPRRRPGHAARAPAHRAQRPGAVRLAARGATSRRRPPTRSATRSRAR